MLTVVHPPTEKEESIRSVIRCRIALWETEKRVNRQINTFLLGRGFHWDKSKWTEAHRQWLSKIELCDGHARMALEEYLVIWNISGHCRMVIDKHGLESLRIQGTAPRSIRSRRREETKRVSQTNNRGVSKTVSWA